METISLVKVFVFLQVIGFLHGYQLFLPVQDNADSIFGYQMVGAGRVSDQHFTIKSIFDLHIRNDSQNRQLKLHIENASGRVGTDEWSEVVIKPLRLPFNITLSDEGAPQKIEYDITKETNYTIARKELILQQLIEIHSEHKKYAKKPRNAYAGVENLENMPFGTCSTKINASLSMAYFTIDYEATRNDCKGKVDPFFTMDLNVDLFGESEFFKSYAFTKVDLDFQYVRLDALMKLQSSPEMDVEIYTLFTLKEILVDPEPDEENTETPTTMTTISTSS